MKQAPKHEIEGTSFSGLTFQASPAELRMIFGEPAWETNDRGEKTNFDWVMQTESGRIFTVYDWKEYRRIGEDETITWHIGTRGSGAANQALEEIQAGLDSIRNIEWIETGEGS
jgi:hypothetical protein